MLNNRSQLLTALAVGVPSAVGIYLLYRYLSGRKNAAITNKEFNLGEFDDETLNMSVSEIREHLTDKPLRNQEGAIEEIYRKSVDVIKPQFVELTQHYRRQRRDLTEPAEQVNSIIEYEAKVKELKDNSLNCILARLDIPEDVWNMEVMAWLTPERTEEWEALLADLEQELNQALPTKKKAIAVDQLHNIFRHHIHFLQHLDAARYGLNTLKKDEVLGVVNHLVSDELYRKFKVEKEDIDFALGQLNEEQYRPFEKEIDEISELNTGFLVGDEA